MKKISTFELVLTAFFAYSCDHRFYCIGPSDRRLFRRRLWDHQYGAFDLDHHPAFFCLLPFRTDLWE